MSFRKAVSLSSALSLVLALSTPAVGLAQATGAGAASPAPAPAPVATAPDCTMVTVARLVGPSARVQLVETVAGMGGLCRVQGVVITRGEGAPEGSARFELNLPGNWNGKMLFLGGGGFDGNIPQAPADRLAAGYATLGTDSGHVESALYPPGGVDASWAVTAPGVKDEAKVIDYAYRSRHQVDAQVRPVIGGFYGRPIDRSYFVGCSGGGREAMIEAQRNPDSFDGFIAGDPSVDSGSVLLAARNFRVLTQAPISFAQFGAIDQAVLADCDGKDGVEDGLIQNPALCSFDPRSLVSTGVLTAEQAQALNAYLSAPMDTEGRRIGFGSSVSGMGDLSGAYPGMTGGLSGLSAYLSDGMQPNSGPWPWGPMPAGSINWLLFNGAISFLSMAQPNLSILDETVSTPDGRLHGSVARIVEEALSPSRVHPDQMGNFFRSGSKLIIYQGFNDTILDPYPVMKVYAEMTKAAGGLEKAQDSARLFMVPGMGHCAGGPGPNMFDPLIAMENWVERGVAPDSIVAVKFQDNNPANPVERSMPLCPFPQAARFDGEGRIEDANNWTCSAEDARLLEVGPNGLAAGVGDIVSALR